MDKKHAFIRLGRRCLTDPEGKFLFAYFCAVEQTTTMAIPPKTDQEPSFLLPSSPLLKESIAAHNSFAVRSPAAAFVLATAFINNRGDCGIMFLLPVCGSLTGEAVGPSSVGRSLWHVYCGWQPRVILGNGNNLIETFRVEWGKEGQIVEGPSKLDVLRNSSTSFLGGRPASQILIC